MVRQLPLMFPHVLDLYGSIATSLSLFFVRDAAANTEY